MCQLAPDFKWPSHCALLTYEQGHEGNGLEDESAMYYSENAPRSVVFIMFDRLWCRCKTCRVTVRFLCLDNKQIDASNQLCFCNFHRETERTTDGISTKHCISKPF